MVRAEVDEKQRQEREKGRPSYPRLDRARVTGSAGSGGSAGSPTGPPAPKARPSRVRAEVDEIHRHVDETDHVSADDITLEREPEGPFEDFDAERFFGFDKTNETGEREPQVPFDE